MKKTIIIQLLAILILSAGCGGNDKQNTESGNVGKDTLYQKHESENNDEEAETAGKLILNNGVKWDANAETTEGIKKMETMVNEYLNKNDSDNKKLSASLEKEFTIILQKCTMTGEAHEQLHHFLLPLKEKIEKLNKTDDRDAYKEIQSHLNNYYNYFN